jgi:hypothetical protein
MEMNGVFEALYPFFHKLSMCSKNIIETVNGEIHVLSGRIYGICSPPYAFRP